MFFLYLYTIILLAALFSATALCCAGFAISRSRRFVIQAAFIGIYLAEIVLIFGEEWLVQNMPDEIATGYYGISYPLLHLVIGSVMALCEWLAADALMGRSSNRMSYAACAAQTVTSIAVLFMPYGALRQWLFYAVRQAFLLLCLIRVAVGYIRGNDTIKGALAKDRGIFIVLCALVVLTSLEDWWSIMLLPVPDETTSELIMFPVYRNVAENATMLLLGWYFAHEAWRLIAMHFDRPIGHDDTGAPETAETVQTQIVLTMPAFAQAHNLTEREREVLSLLLEGKNNRDIGGALFVTEGTVKTHLHNLMKKTGTQTRDELRQAFWAH